MKHRLFAVATAVSLVGLAMGSGLAHACKFALRAVPAPGGDLSATGSIILGAPSRHPLLHGLDERGPVLRSPSDVVPLRVGELIRDGGRAHAVLVPARPLIADVRYELALTRTHTGFGLQRAEVPDPRLAWVARAEAPRLTATPDQAPPRPSLLGRLLVFGALPFFVGYAGVAILLALARRRRRW
jgi:hypothetical protein